MSKLGTLWAVAVGLSVLAGCAGEPDTGTSFTKLTPAPKFDGDPANQALFAVDVSFWETPLAQAEMDCFWDSGVRHVVVGTQQQDITREQLAMAVSRGMTVDAYVYLYWDTDMTAQVKQAFQNVSGFPIGRMWLDIEQDPGGRGANVIIADVQQALTACKAQGGVECGIYTGSGFWKTYMNDTTAFTDVPLWWAHYDNKTSLSTWSADHFGGWTKPVAKQWATKPLCGVGGPDWDTMQVTATPTVVVDHATPADTGAPPPAPTGLWPVDGMTIPVDYAKVMSQTIPLATKYDLAIERWGGSAWIPYYTWSNPNAFVKFSPSKPNQLYHFRVRAQNAHGWGAWSEWSMFQYGKYTGPFPTPSSPAPDAGTPPTTDAGAPPPPPPPGVPGGLTPDGNALITTSNVALACSAVQNATNYEFAVESQGASGWAPYYTYPGTTPARTFYPQVHGIAYRFRVRAKVAGTFGDWSSYATFQFK